MKCDDYFYCLENFPDMEQEFVNQGLTTEYQLEKIRPRAILYRSIFPPRIENSHIYRYISERFDIQKAAWLMFPPKTNYNWHVDSHGYKTLSDSSGDVSKKGRNCAINIPIQVPDEAATYVGEPFFHPQGSTLPPVWYGIERVKYVIYKPTILNIQKEHCVINPTDSSRIVLSISLKEEYEEVLSKMLN
jgi:hypothetical protein